MKTPKVALTTLSTGLCLPENQLPSPASLKARDESRVTIPDKPPSYIMSRGLKRLGFGLVYLDISIFGGFSLFKTGAFQVGINKAIEILKLVPGANRSISEEDEEQIARFDSGFKSIDGFEKLEDRNLNNLDIRRYDLNKNNIALDTEAEINLLREEILGSEESTKNITGRKSALQLFDELTKVKKLVWGIERNYKNTIQAGRPNCQVMGGLQAHYLTEEHFQNLKHLLKVTDYNLSEDDFYINFEVTLGNERIPVSYENVVHWMNQKGIAQSRDKEGALAIPALTYAIEKILTEKSDGVPPTFPIAAPNLLTGKSHVLLGISPFTVNTLSDNQLIEILKNAPKKQVLAVSWGNLSISEWWNKSRGDFKLLPISSEQETEFRASVIEKANQIKERIETKKSDGNVALNNESKDKETNKPNPENNSNTTKEIQIFTALIASDHIKNTTPVDSTNQTSDIPTESYSDDFPSNHLFVVKDFDEQSGMVTITDSHEKNYRPLTLDEFREKVGGIIIETKDAPLFNAEELLGLYFLTLLSFYATKKGSSIMERKVNYGYTMGDLIKSYFEKINPLVTEEDKKEDISEREKELYTVLTIALLRAAMKYADIDEQFITYRASSMDTNKLADYLGLGYWYTENIVDFLIKNRREHEDIPSLDFNLARKVENEFLKAA